MLDGVIQRYHVHGRGPICVAHPGGPGIGWEYLRMEEIEDDFTVVYVEPIGTGQSGRLSNTLDYRIDTFARFLAAVVDHVSDEAVFVIGHSHGGFVALHYALLNPAKVRGLVLYSTSPTTTEGFGARASANVERLAADHPDLPEIAAVPEAYAQVIRATDDESFMDGLRGCLYAYFGDFRRCHPQIVGMQAALEAWVTPSLASEISRYDVRPSLARLTAPTLILVGELDFICGPHWARMLLDSGSPTTYVEFPGVGHFIHIEQPGAVIGALRAFSEDRYSTQEGTGSA